MAAHAATTAHSPLALRPLLVVLVATATVLIAANADAVMAAANAACTTGTDPGTSCGEALVLLGYP